MFHKLLATLYELKSMIVASNNLQNLNKRNFILNRRRKQISINRHGSVDGRENNGVVNEMRLSEPRSERNNRGV